MISNYGSSDAPGVDVLFKEQDTSEAAAQALVEQKPGSEFTPMPHPDIKGMLARLKELEAQATAICNKLYMGSPPDYMTREDLHEQMANVDREKYALRTQLDNIYETVEGPDSDDSKKPFTGTATVIGADKTAGATTTNAKPSTTNS